MEVVLILLCIAVGGLLLAGYYGHQRTSDIEDWIAENDRRNVPGK